MTQRVWAPFRAIRLMAAVSEQFTRKAFNFDLGTDALKEELGIEDTRKPYSEIGSVFRRLGVEHRQYSGYVSKKPMTGAKAIKTLSELAETLPWFSKVAQRCDVTSVTGEVYDFLAYARQREASSNIDDVLERALKEGPSEVRTASTREIPDDALSSYETSGDLKTILANMREIP